MSTVCSFKNRLELSGFLLCFFFKKNRIKGYKGNTAHLRVIQPNLRIPSFLYRNGMTEATQNSSKILDLREYT